MDSRRTHSGLRKGGGKDSESSGSFHEPGSVSASSSPPSSASVDENSSSEVLSSNKKDGIKKAAPVDRLRPRQRNEKTTPTATSGNLPERCLPNALGGYQTAVSDVRVLRKDTPKLLAGALKASSQGELNQAPSHPVRAAAAPSTAPSAPSTAPVAAVLELRAGLSAELGIAPGLITRRRSRIGGKVDGFGRSKISEAF